MTTWRDVPMPPLVAARPRDARGFPILFTSYIDDEGVPDFRVSDPAKFEQCFHERRCGVCGEPLHDLMVFLSGPMGISNRCFGDPPTHAPCVEYARQVCPYLALGRDRHVPAGAHIGERVVVNTPGGVEDKPAYYGLYATRRYIGCRGDRGGLVFYADLPVWLRWYNQRAGLRETPDPVPQIRRVWPPAPLRIFPSWMPTKERQKL